MPSQTRQVLGRLGVLELLQVLGRLQIGVDLIEVSVAGCQCDERRAIGSEIAEQRTSCTAGFW